MKCYKGTLLLAIHTAHKKRRITLGEKKHPAKLDYKDPWKKRRKELTPCSYYYSTTPNISEWFSFWAYKI